MPNVLKQGFDMGVNPMYRGAPALAPGNNALSRSGGTSAAGEMALGGELGNALSYFTNMGGYRDRLDLARKHAIEEQKLGLEAKRLSNRKTEAEIKKAEREADPFSALQDKRDMDAFASATDPDARKARLNKKDMLERLKRARAEFSGEGMGPLSGAMATIEGWFGSGAGQEIRSIATELQLEVTSKTKGAISDSEMRLFGQSVPGLEMSDKAAARVIAGYEAVMQRDELRDQFFTEYAARNKTARGAETQWKRYINENPLLGGNGPEDLTVNDKVLDPSSYSDYLNPDFSGRGPAQDQDQGGGISATTTRTIADLPDGSVVEKDGVQYQIVGGQPQPL